VKIISPVDHPDEVEPLVAAGADELYCGLAFEEWLGTWTIAALSRRSARIANLGSIEQLARTVSLAHAAGVPVCLTVNEHYYTQAQQPRLLDYLAGAAATGVDALIVADPALLLALREAKLGVELHLSTGTSILNAEAALLFQELGVSRVTLERQQTLAEIERLVAGVPGLETAVFVLNGRCPNVDGLCTYDHSQLPGEAHGNACMVPCKVRCRPTGDDGAPGELGRVAPVVRQRVWERHHMDASPCGACALHDLRRIGVTHLKIVGRGNSARRKLADVRFLRALVTLSGVEALGRDRFRASARLLHAHAYQRPCLPVGCYFPELLPRKGGSGA